jgi:hypothetical protein
MHRTRSAGGLIARGCPTLGFLRVGLLTLNRAVVILDAR